MDLDEKLEQVNSKESFLEFVKALIEDKIDEDRKEALNPSSPFSEGARWQHETIPNYLDAAHAYSADSANFELSWNSFAKFLYAGKFYE